MPEPTNQVAVTLTRDDGERLGAIAGLLEHAPRSVDDDGRHARYLRNLSRAALTEPQQEEGDCERCKNTGHDWEPGPTGEPISTGPCPDCFHREPKVLVALPDAEPQWMTGEEVAALIRTIALANARLATEQQEEDGGAAVPDEVVLVAGRTEEECDGSAGEEVQRSITAEYDPSCKLVQFVKHGEEVFGTLEPIHEHEWAEFARRLATQQEVDGVGEAVAKEIEALEDYNRSMIGAAASSEHGSGYNTGRADGARMGILALQRIAALAATPLPALSEQGEPWLLKAVGALIRIQTHGALSENERLMVETARAGLTDVPKPIRKQAADELFAEFDEASEQGEAG